MLISSHLPENSERILFPGSAGRAWIKTNVLNSELLSLKLVSFATAEFLKTGHTTCKQQAFGRRGGGVGGVCKILTLRITFVYLFLTNLANIQCMLPITRNCAGSCKLKEKQDTVPDLKELTF